MTTLLHTCEADGTEGETVTYRFRENGQVIESGKTTSFMIVQQRFAAFRAVRLWAEENA